MWDKRIVTVCCTQLLLLQIIALVIQLPVISGRGVDSQDPWNIRNVRELEDLFDDETASEDFAFEDDRHQKFARETPEDLHGLEEVFGQKITRKADTAPAKEITKDSHGRVQMGVPTTSCDDGKTNLTTDWDASPVNYTCFHPETRFPEGQFLEPLQECQDLPASYMPNHLCMNESIPYNHNIPTHGDHRPLWAKFGEYLFVPRERWLHNIEHGAVVMLYHPCTHPMEVDRLRTILTGCYGKHVITPSTLLTRDRPLALVAWGCRLQMSMVDDFLAIQFIREKALHGPEGKYTKEGQFDVNLIRFANATGNAVYDRVTC